MGERYTPTTEELHLDQNSQDENLVEKELIQDPNIAHVMAKAEDSYHERRFGGLIPPSAKKLREGEVAANRAKHQEEDMLEDARQRQEYQKKWEERRAIVKDLTLEVQKVDGKPDNYGDYKVVLKGSINGHVVEIVGSGKGHCYSGYQGNGFEFGVSDKINSQIAGTIDGKPLSQRQAMEIFDKYEDVAISPQQLAERKKNESTKQEFDDIMDTGGGKEAV